MTIKITDDDKRELLGLIWALKGSDLSNLQVALQKPLETQVGTTRGSTNDLFWSRLVVWDLAEEVPFISEGLSPAEVAAVKNMKTFMLTPGGAEIINGGMELALNTGWPPHHAVISGDVVLLLRNYVAETYAPNKRQALAKLGILYSEGKGVEQNIEEALGLYREAAELGDMTALNNLGVAYFLGEGVPRDEAQAFSWFEKAALAGSTGAMDNIGSMYSAGRGVPQDYSQAAVWYRKAADMGRATAMCNLGDMYAQGQGVPQDKLQAYIWYSLGVAFGLDARKPRDEIALTLSPEQLDEARAFIGNWRPTPAAPQAN